MQGFLNLNKPADWTSHDCVAKVRRLVRLKQVGHAGTLDPTATGVLPIALGKATRLLQFLPSEKAYRAKIRFGVTTTTDDLAGEELTHQPVPGLTLEQVRPMLPQFLGVIQQVPPRYSAIHVQGKRLYDLARTGEEVEIPTRTVEIFGIEPLNWQPGDFPELEISITCGAGTYIRSIARDLGEKLNVGATLAALIRTESSGFPLATSLTLADLETRANAGTFQPISEAEALKHVKAIALAPDKARRWSQGQQVQCDYRELCQLPVRVYGQDGQFLGIGQVNCSDQGVLLVPQVVFLP
ncbi:MAG: tRNA pseudouridine(55) synthase TruB [Microcoleaceae cyanobacterium]